MIARLARRIGIVVGIVLLAGACGGDDVGIFDEQVAEVRGAVQSGDRDAALTAIDDLAVLALGAHEEGQVDDAELQEVSALIDHARRLLDDQLPEPTTTTTSTTAPPPPVELDHDDHDDDDHDDDDDDDGRGKGNKGKGDKDDD